jgi:hypothetical protein
LIEARFFDSLERYVQEHIRCGGFLNAVLENNLVGAVTRADRDASIALRQIVLYIYNEMPGNCWGDSEKVKAWVAQPYNPVCQKEA